MSCCGVGFEESRPSLLLGIAVRDRRKRSSADTASAPSSSKKVKVDVVIAAPAATAARSYTPPPVPTDPRKKPPAPVPPPVPKLPDAASEKDDMGKGYSFNITQISPKVFFVVFNYDCFVSDEPYSPGDSSPETVPTSGTGSTHLNAADLTNILTGSVKTNSFLDTGISLPQFQPFANKFDAIPGNFLYLIIVKYVLF